MTDRWFVRLARRERASTQLFCLPYAGAGASIYRDWPAAFGADVEVNAVQLPGRESRFGDRSPLDPAELAAAIAARADRPFALFGHSFGGRLAFEVARALRRRGGPMPRRLYPSGCRPPHVKVMDGPLDGLSTAPEELLIDRLAAGGAMPAAVLAERELLDLVLPVVRADLAWLDEYRYVDEPPLDLPIAVFCGRHDEVVSPEVMRGWNRHTSVSFIQHVLPGGHFFLNERLADLARLVEYDLLVGAPGQYA